MLQQLLHGLVAQTQDAAPEGPGGLLSSPLPVFALIFVAMYFLIIRPQQKQQKEQQQFLSQLKKGDDVLLTGGLFGKVYAVGDVDVTVEIAPNVRVRALKSAVARAAPDAAAVAKTDDKTDKKA